MVYVPQQSDTYVARVRELLHTQPTLALMDVELALCWAVSSHQRMLTTTTAEDVRQAVEAAAVVVERLREATS